MSGSLLFDANMTVGLLSASDRYKPLKLCILQDWVLATSPLGPAMCGVLRSDVQELNPLIEKVC